ncbi:NADPH-dependent FMN reductase [Flavisolibacter nicotianae]|uniref:NADPH-dependent FMN reductase n=1 Tax=Flavisolibacter nicotianae TaxID=2364882 RepID=UPI000EB44156|nr:NAD(P)H-dependent oxidoreductase [Flavisolibacter nicotianae]
MRIEIVSGSPRTNSVTHRVALHLYRLFQQRTEHEIGLLEVRSYPLPLLQKVFASVEETPEQFKGLAHRLFSADAFVLVTPEYNGSYSPAMQNLFDHFPKQHHKVFGLVTASPGALGGMRAAMQLQQFTMALFGIPSPYMLITPQVDKKFAADGTLTDPSFEKSIDTFVHEYLWLAEKLVEEKVPA